MPESKPPETPANEKLALAVILAGNLVPVVGVIAFGWKLFDIMALYWLENGIVGVLTIPRLILSGIFGNLQSKKGPAGPGVLLFFIPFFCFHYGLFWLGHGAFVLELFGKESIHAAGSSLFGPALAMIDYTLAWPIVLAVAGLAVAHLVPLYTQFISTGRFRKSSPPVEMIGPYPRVVILHITLLIGAFLSLALGTPVVALLLLTILKTGYEILALRFVHLMKGKVKPRESAA